MKESDLDGISPWAAEQLPYQECVLDERWEDWRANNQPIGGQLKNIHDSPGVLATAVEPVWDSIGNHTAEEFTEQVIKEFAAIEHRRCLQASVRLYGLFYYDTHIKYAAWTLLRQSFIDAKLHQCKFVHDYLLHWVEKSPSKCPVFAALFFLRYSDFTVDSNKLILWAAHDEFAYQSSSLIAESFSRLAAQEALIEIAKMHEGTTREDVLRFVLEVGVVKQEHKDWLLDGGYDSDDEYAPCQYYAAVCGDFLERLRLPSLSEEQLFHAVKLLGGMADASGGSTSWMSIIDYEPRYEAFQLLLDHLHRYPNAELTELWEFKFLLRFLTHQIYETTSNEEIVLCDDLYRQGRELLVALNMSEEEIKKALYWERSERTAADLYTKGVIALDGVLRDAVTYRGDNTEKISEIVVWAEDFLCLQQADEVKSKRKEELAALEMPGGRVGGSAGLKNDPRLCSVYGQILLYLLLKVRPTELVDGLIAQAALEADYQLLHQAAAKAIQGWPEELLTPTLNDAWQAYKRRHN